MGTFSDLRGNVRFWLKGYLFLGVAVLIVVMLVYSNHLISRMEAHSQATSRLFSRFIANQLFEIDDQGKLSVLQEVMAETTLPIIITWRDGRPIAWRRVPVPDMEDDDWEWITTMDPSNPPEGKASALMALVERFDRINDPMPVEVLGANDVMGYVHFGKSRLQKELRIMPIIQLGLFLVFLGVAVQGFRYLRISEQRSIWVGLAKETAHQLGTPLSSLLGWIQLIKDKVASGRYDEVEPSIREMEIDLARLEKVTERFSKIGSHPELKQVNLAKMLERTVSYFHRRLPRLKSDSTISLVLRESPQIRGNEELLEWVFENLIKNGLDALGDGGGTIEIRTEYRRSKQLVEVFVKDTGKGIPSSQREQIFRPGFTTKKRGWGLGLALTRRIVEDYHKGSLKLLDSRPGKGTTFVVRLPVG